jgi:hypothetical protein
MHPRCGRPRSDDDDTGNDDTGNDDTGNDDTGNNDTGNRLIRAVYPQIKPAAKPAMRLWPFALTQTTRWRNKTIRRRSLSLQWRGWPLGPVLPAARGHARAGDP